MAGSKSCIDAAKTLIQERDHVSIAELRSFAKDYMTVDGDVGLSAGDENLIIWGGMSQDFADLVELLLDSEDIAVVPSEPLVYLIDGHALMLPIARRPPKNGYKKPHWLPIVFRPADRVKEAND